MSTDWRFVSTLVVRRTSFPFELLEELSFSESVAQMDCLLAAEQEAEKAKRNLLGRYFVEAVKSAHEAGDTTALKLLSKYRQRVAKGRIDRSHVEAVQRHWPGTAFAEHFAALAYWNEQAQRQYEAGQALFTQELAHKRRRLQELVRRPDIAEAVFLSNPDVYEHAYQHFVAHHEFTQRPARLKMLERRFMLYLQRFIAKNDTASFFGPMNYARIDQNQEEPLRLEIEPGLYSKRAVFYSFWMVNVLAEVISREPSIQPYIAPSLHPLCKLTDTGIEFLPEESSHRLPTALRQLVVHVNGQRIAGELAALQGTTVTQLLQQLQPLIRAGLLLFRIEIPSTTFDPFAALQQAIWRLPTNCAGRTRWLKELERFASWMHLFRDADLPERVRLTKQMEQAFTALTGLPPRRFPGQAYADRTLYYEECAGTMRDFVFGKPFFTDLSSRLKPLMDFSVAHGELLREHYQLLGKRIFAVAGQGRTEIPYARFIHFARLCQETGTLDQSDPAYESFRREFTALVQAKQRGNSACLTAADLQSFQRFVKGQAVHISPDLMFAAPDQEAFKRGDYQIVLGEIHQFIAMWGSQLLFDPERERVEQEVEALLATLPPYTHLATILNTRQHKGLLHESFPGKLIQFLGQPSERARQVLALSDLVIRLHNDELELVHRPTGESLTVYNSGEEQLHLWCFAPPRVAPIVVNLGSYTPRIEIDGVVYQRACWRLQAGDLLQSTDPVSDYDLWLTLRRAWQRYELPRRAFVRFPGEKKPYFLDSDNFFLLEILHQEMQKYETLSFTEMLPGPQDLWLRDDDGSYCLEVRGTAFRAPYEDENIACSDAVAQESVSEKVQV